MLPSADVMAPGPGEKHLRAHGPERNPPRHVNTGALLAAMGAISVSSTLQTLGQAFAAARCGGQLHGLFLGQRKAGEKPRHGGRM